MPIEWNAETRELHLFNGEMSYLLCLFASGHLGHLYFGGPLAAGRRYRHLQPHDLETFDNGATDGLGFEYPTHGSGDFRAPALALDLADGSPALDLIYAGHRILAGKAPLAGLPATYVERAAEADTLEVDLRDGPSGAEVVLSYTIFRDHAALCRSARVRNAGASPLTVRCAMSASLDLDGGPWDMLQLSGRWAHERQLVGRRVVQGSQSIESRRGASSHQQNPFVALERPGATEETGEAYGFSLVYSGNFLADVEADGAGTTRVRIGINPAGFSWRLEAGAELQLPEAVLVRSDRGRGGLSDAYHRLYRSRLARGAWRDRPRPVLINNWEGTYFGFSEAKLLEMGEVARELGIELFVLDDGWFGERDSDTTSLGDWTVDRRKLPGGLDGLARQIEALGMKFGLWIEPEMVSPKSRLFAQHPEWAIAAPGRRRTQIRNQYVLDLSRPDVVEWMHDTISRVLASAPLSYVKWDMNRSITEPFGGLLPADRQGEFFHRYMLGVYSVYERVTARFPEILFESCAGGGGRFDPGLLAYAPQAWTSDDSDAIERLGIQWGTSLVYPPSSMGAHVSAVPNHQVGRVTPLATRAAVAFFGVFGYELDPTALSADERAAIAVQIAFYKQHRDLLQAGRFLRLIGPAGGDGDGNETAWMCVSDDRRRAIVGFYRVLQRPAAPAGRLRLRGLDPAAVYRVSTWPDDGDP
ncbi:MAG TPA: alpha-galactosidase, partial [Candidatus Acidoferrum sp.]|nr:alpha-galactosidase [Candidatus Acidoferrum sp.]